MSALQKLVVLALDDPEMLAAKKALTGDPNFVMYVSLSKSARSSMVTKSYSKREAVERLVDGTTRLRIKGDHSKGPPSSMLKPSDGAASGDDDVKLGFVLTAVRSSQTFDMNEAPVFETEIKQFFENHSRIGNNQLHWTRFNGADSPFSVSAEGMTHAPTRGPRVISLIYGTVCYEMAVTRLV